MDERDTILEHYSAKTKLIKRWKSRVSCSPILRKRSHDGYNLSPHTNLRSVVDLKNNGCPDDQFSLSTRLISGHNTPLPNMTHAALFEINKDQDDLLAKLKKKEQMLEM